MYDDCYCPNCKAEQIANFSNGKSKTPVFNKKVFDDAIKHLHTVGKITPKMLKDKPVKALTVETNKHLMDAVNYGIGDNVVPEVMRQKLANDTYIFSGFKTYSQLKTASELLLDDNGKRKQFAQFARDVEAIHANYNKRYLEAEFYFAQGSAQMAAKWAALEDNGRTLLQYRTAGDSHVRDSHAALRDTTLPFDDDFWDSFYPPNGWRCRCQAIEVSKDRYKESNSAEAIKAGNAATTQIGKDGKNSLAIFRFNPGKQQVIFPPKHPYKGDLSKCGNANLADGGGQDEKCKVLNELQKQLPAENDFRVRRKELQDQAKVDLKDVQVKHKALDEKISFTNKGIKEYLNQPHKQLAEKNELIATMPSVLKKSEYKGSFDDIKNNIGLKIHVFEIDIEKEKSYLIVRENTAGVMQFYSISDSDKILDSIKDK